MLHIPAQVELQIMTFIMKLGLNLQQKNEGPKWWPLNYTTCHKTSYYSTILCSLTFYYILNANWRNHQEKTFSSTNSEAK